jgi:hypothetical protein
VAGLLKEARDLVRPSPASMPPRRWIPPAPQLSTPHNPPFEPPLPRRGHAAAEAYLDTGVLYAAGRTRHCVEKLAAHYGQRLHIADIVRDEVLHRAASHVGPERQLEKNAAATVKDVLFDRLQLEGESSLASDDDILRFDEIVNQLRGLAAANVLSSPTDLAADRHVGEAATLVCCMRLAATGSKVVFLTNDGNASRVAGAHGIQTGTFCDGLRELVCSGLYTSERAFQIHNAAIVVTRPPSAFLPSGESSFRCRRQGTVCAPCDALTA